MAADPASVIAAALSTRDFWDALGDVAAVAVAVGVILEAVTEFAWLAKLTGLWTRRKLRKGIAKAGLVILIISLIAEVIIGRYIKNATDIIESQLTTGVNNAVAANVALDTKIKSEQNAIVIAQGQIDNLVGEAANLSTALDRDRAETRSQFTKDECALTKVSKRRLKEEWKARILTLIKNTPGTVADVLVGDGTWEEGYLGSDLVDVFHQAGWKVNAPSAPGKNAGSGGISVSNSQTSDQKLKGPLRALVKELNDDCLKADGPGIFTGVMMQIKGQLPNPDVVIIIGAGQTDRSPN